MLRTDTYLKINIISNNNLNHIIYKYIYILNLHARRYY